MPLPPPRGKAQWLLLAGGSPSLEWTLPSSLFAQAQRRSAWLRPLYRDATPAAVRVAPRSVVARRRAVVVHLAVVLEREDARRLVRGVARTCRAAAHDGAARASQRRADGAAQVREDALLRALRPAHRVGHQPGRAWVVVEPHLPRVRDESCVGCWVTHRNAAESARGWMAGAATWRSSCENEVAVSTSLIAGRRRTTTRTRWRTTRPCAPTPTRGLRC